MGWIAKERQRRAAG